MKLIQRLVVSFLLVATLPVLAETVEEKLKKTLTQRLGEGTQVETIIKTPYNGLYEVKVGNEIIYSDAEGKFVFIGRILETETSKDITQARLDEINKIKFSDLPLEASIKSVKGNGKRVIAVFEDPNCGYCKRFRKTLADTKDITIYTFMYPILSDDSRAKVKNVACSADKAKAWDDWMINGKTPAAAAESCNATASTEKVLELGRKLKVTGTPTIFFIDGTRVPGAIDAKTLESRLASAK
ncbi:MAG: DsbC family protein [Oxalobacteraceae bacterium]|jgi:thiol:disulfide interchange protein DsbC|nr:DsbC family protein [Oxalobacteraceae bacterium]